MDSRMARHGVRTPALIAAAAFALAACSQNAPPAPAPDPSVAAAAAAARELVLYDQMRASGSWELAASLGDEVVQKYPSSPAAATVHQSLDEVHAKAAGERETRRLAKLWSYTAVPEAGGTQYAAAIASREPLKSAPDPKAAARIQLVLRQHPQWGQSVYLLLDNATFDCSKGCATLPVAFDGAAPRRMKATIPPTGEPALFIDDDKGFIAKLSKARTVSIDATIKGEGAKTFVFEVGGFDPSKLPNPPK
jgi:hypothetical protein